MRKKRNYKDKMATIDPLMVQSYPIQQLEDNNRNI